MSNARFQFGLSSLLWFVLASAAYSSQLAFRFDSEWGQDWRTPATVAIAWGVLGSFYLARNLRELFATHCLGLVAYITLVMIFVPEERSIPNMITTGCFFGNQLSFPIYLIVVIVQIYTGLREYFRERQHKAELLLAGRWDEGDSFTEFKSMP